MRNHLLGLGLLAALEGGCVTQEEFAYTDAQIAQMNTAYRQQLDIVLGGTRIAGQLSEVNQSDALEPVLIEDSEQCLEGDPVVTAEESR